MQHRLTIDILHRHLLHHIDKQIPVLIHRQARNRIERHIALRHLPSDEIPLIIDLDKARILQVIIIIRDVIHRLGILSRKDTSQSVNLRLQRLSRVPQPEITYRIQINQILTESLQPSEQIMVYPLKVSHPALHRIVRVSLQSIDHINIRRIAPHRHHLNDTFSVRVVPIVNPHERIALLDDIDRVHTIHRTPEVLECDPIQTILIIFQTATLGLCDSQLIRLRNRVVILLTRQSVELLNLDIIANPERVV